MVEWFTTWFDTDYYHQLYRNHSYAEADAFVEKLFEENILKPDQRILELACGKGRHAIAMHRFGAEVVGIDLSPHSIMAAMASEEPGLSFYVHDMRLPFPEAPGSFGACTNLFTSFGYFDDTSQNVDVLRNVAVVLKPGGYFVLDYMNAAYVTQHLITHQEEVRGHLKFFIHKVLQDGQIIKTIRVEDAGWTHGPFQERVQAFTAAQLVAFCTEAGLGVRHLYGDYTLAPFREAVSPRCILICKK